MINLMPGEQMLLESGPLTLTSYRVRHEQVGWFRAQTVSILLEEVSSCGLAYRSWGVFLLLAALLMLGGLTVNNTYSGLAYLYGSAATNYLAIGLVVALIFVGLYFITRRQAVVIAPAGRLAIVHFIGGANRTVALQIIEAVEAAKIARVASLAGRGAAAMVPPVQSMPPIAPPVSSPAPFGGTMPQPAMSSSAPASSQPKNCTTCGKPLANPASRFCQACGSPQ